MLGVLGVGGVGGWRRLANAFCPPADGPMPREPGLETRTGVTKWYFIYVVVSSSIVESSSAHRASEHQKDAVRCGHALLQLPLEEARFQLGCEARMS